MIGDVIDIVGRMRVVLPWGWFGDTAPNLGAVLTGIGTAWSAIYGLVQAVRGEARIATADGSFLDMASTDFFAASLPRLASESDDAFRLRIDQEMLRPRGTRAALTLAMQEATGRLPTIFEPRLTSDTGGYAAGGVGYGVGGGWGNLDLPFQCFVTVFRPATGGIAMLGGYGTGGVQAYADLSMVPAGLSDADIYAAVARILPVATTAWTRISS